MAESRSSTTAQGNRLGRHGEDGEDRSAAPPAVEAPRAPGPGSSRSTNSYGGADPSGSFLEGQAGHRYEPGGEAKPLFCDVFEETRGNLVEAKGSCARETIRMALGQLLDYARFEKPATARGVLVPTMPRKDLVSLLASANVFVVWKDSNGGFVDYASGRFT